MAKEINGISCDLKEITDIARALGCGYVINPPDKIIIFSDNGNKLPDLLALLKEIAFVSKQRLVYVIVDNRKQYIKERKNIVEWADSLKASCQIGAGRIDFVPKDSHLSKLVFLLISKTGFFKKENKEAGLARLSDEALMIVYTSSKKGGNKIMEEAAENTMNEKAKKTPKM